MASRATLAFLSVVFCAAVVAGNAAVAESGRRLLSQSNSNSQTQTNDQSNGNFAAIFDPSSPFSTVDLTQENYGDNNNDQEQDQTAVQSNVGRKLLDQTNSNSQTQQNMQTNGNFAAIFNPVSPFSSVAITQENSGDNVNDQEQTQAVNQANTDLGRKLLDQSNSNSQSQQNLQTNGNYFSLSVPTSIVSADQVNAGNNLNYQFQTQDVTQTNTEGRKLLDQSNSNSQTQSNAQTNGNYFSVSVPFDLITAAQTNYGDNVNYQFQTQDVTQTNTAGGRKLLDQSNDNSQAQDNEQINGNAVVLHFPYSVLLTQVNNGDNNNEQVQGQWVQQTNTGRKLLDQSNTNSQAQDNEQINGNVAVLHFPYSVALSQVNQGSNENTQVQGQWVQQTNIG